MQNERSQKTQDSAVMNGFEGLKPSHGKTKKIKVINPFTSTKTSDCSTQIQSIAAGPLPKIQFLPNPILESKAAELQKSARKTIPRRPQPQLNPTFESTPPRKKRSGSDLSKLEPPQKRKKHITERQRCELKTPVTAEGNEPKDLVMKDEHFRIKEDEHFKIKEDTAFIFKPEAPPPSLPLKLIQPEPHDMPPFFLQRPDIGVLPEQSYVPKSRKQAVKDLESKWDRPQWYYFDDRAKSKMFAVIDKLRKWDEEGLFCYPVDTKEYNDYLDIIKEPLDLQTIRTRVQLDHYWDVHRDLRRDLELMTANCRNYSFEAQDIIDYCNKFDVESSKVLQAAENNLRVRFWKSSHKQSARGKKSGTKVKRRKSHTPRTSRPTPPSMDKKKKQKLNVGDNATKKSGKKKEAIKFTTIDDYVAVTDPEIVKLKMSTKKSVRCDGLGCQQLSDLGPFSLFDFEFKGKCACRNANVECTDACGCDPVLCRNRPVQKKEAYKLDQDLRQQEAYGIDCYTRLQLLKLFDPEQVQKQAALDFLEHEYMPAINDFLFFVDKHPQFKSTFPQELKENTDQALFYVWDVLETIKQKSFKPEAAIQPDQYYYAQALKSMLTCLRYGMTHKHAIRMSWSDQKNEVSMDPNQVAAKTLHDLCYNQYPIYAKGAGIVCLRKGGIPANSLVTEFFGEVYLPYRWHEKEDGIRWVEKFLDSKELNFHNVNLERHPDDPDGYDLVVVDPQIKGNYACRISHQCDANLSLVTTVVNGRYVLGLYSNRHIPYGQELGFDYCAVTENEQEWKDATCLCGSPRCRGFYLEYSGNRAFSEIMKAKHTLLHRMAMLLRAGHTSLDQEDMQRLLKHGIGNSLVSDCPPWIKKFFASVLEFVDQENRELPNLLKEGYEALEYDDESAQIQAQGITANRIVNVAITIDKIKHFLLDKCNQSICNLPPLRILTPKEVVSNLWNANDSLIQNLKGCLKSHRELTEGLQALMTPRKMPETKEGLERIKKMFIQIAKELGGMQSTTNCKHHAAGDVLVMYAHTKTFFTSHPYNSVTSAPLLKEHLNIHYSLLSKKDRLRKKYKSEFAFGQCMFWMKQTIADPTASLSADRRGTICLPSIDCCYGTTGKPLGRVYDEETRDRCLELIEQRPHEQWSVKFHWKFRWGFKKKFYGTPWFDAYFDRDDSNCKKVLRILRERSLVFPSRM